MDQMDRLTNPLVDCEATIKHINLDAWREDPPVGPQSAATATSTTNTGTFSHIISSLPAGGTSHTTVCQVKILFLGAKLLDKSLSCRSDLKRNFTCWYTRQIEVFVNLTKEHLVYNLLGPSDCGSCYKRHLFIGIFYYLSPSYFFFFSFSLLFYDP